MRNELRDRFTSHSSILKNFTVLLPQIQNEGCECTDEDVTGMRNLCDFYKEDLDCSVECAIGELSLWYRHMKQILTRSGSGAIIKCNPLTYIQYCDREVFPCIYKLLKILITVPLSTSTNERSFSTLRRLKTYLRNTTGEDRLNGLAL